MCETICQSMNRLNDKHIEVGSLAGCLLMFRHWFYSLCCPTLCVTV